MSSGYNYVKRAVSSGYSYVKRAVSGRSSSTGSSYSYAGRTGSSGYSRAPGSAYSSSGSRSGGTAGYYSSRGTQSGGQWVQQRVQSRYESALQAGKTDYNWGQSKIKEAGNVWNSWTKSMENTVKHFCTTAERVKKTSAAAAKTTGRTSGPLAFAPAIPLILEALIWVLGVASVSTLTKSGYKAPITGKTDYTKVALKLAGITGNIDALILGAKIGYKQASDAIKQAVDKNRKKIEDKIKSISEGTGGSKDKDKSVKEGNVEDLPDNAKDSYKDYENNDWKGKSNKTSGTKDNKTFKNNEGKLPKNDGKGNDITYKEHDINNKVTGKGRDAERFVTGSDGSVYYTNDHYDTFTKIK